MKTLHNHIILYDAECPMCNLYTSAFVRNGLLDNREAYQQYSGATCPNLDWQRAVNEIALVNQATGEVTYGVDSLLKVCENAVPFLGPLFRWKPFLWLANSAYAFISYNRRVIVPVPVSESRFVYQPSFNMKYRIAWLVFAWLVTSCILGAYPWLAAGIHAKGAISQELAISAGHILCQASVIFLYRKNKTWDYLGNLMTISLAGALLFFVCTIICVWFNLGWLVSAWCFAPVVFLIFLEHLRRSKLLGIGYLLTATWVLYRVIILIILLKLLP
jgi:predicted DCC family thiol-disulfide oxidoreductase YuxK